MLERTCCVLSNRKPLWLYRVVEKKKMPWKNLHSAIGSPLFYQARTRSEKHLFDTCYEWFSMILKMDAALRKISALLRSGANPIHRTFKIITRNMKSLNPEMHRRWAVSCFRACASVLTDTGDLTVERDSLTFAQLRR